MKYFISALLASMLAISGVATAQVLGVVGWAQGGGANSSSNVSGGGGGGSAGNGFAFQASGANATNLSV
ncbi:MAG: hypothetical protein DRQ89_15340 [Epsilonproteobacteria bacterium]|nr:MAG: hypothetical protein DRQ89_15340 [Campylobacterota bacterium]